MKCPHCQVTFHSSEDNSPLGTDADASWRVARQMCPACKRLILTLHKCEILRLPNGQTSNGVSRQATLFRPKGAQRPQPPAEVPVEFREDFIEACLVLADSPKASAALSRRCLQHLLRDVAKVKHGDLYSEIEEVVSSGRLPTYIAEPIDAVRHIGNFAAHPLKSKITGEIVPVEPGEAEWNLDVLEALFDFYFVQPEVLKKKKDALNTKLVGAGKQPMK